MVVFLLIALLALIAAPVSAYYHYTKSAPGSGGSFTEGMIGQPIYINPLLSQSNDVDKDLANLVYAGLTKYGADGTIIGDMADLPIISSDGLTYTFKLKPNLIFHDSVPVTADDILFTVLTAQNADYRSYQRVYWHGVDAAKIDERTVVFKLKNRYGQFLSYTTMGILPKHIWDNVKPSSFSLSTSNLAPIGSGPYRLNNLDRDSTGIRGMTLKSFKKYEAGQPYISTIYIKFYDSESSIISAYNHSDIDTLSFLSPRKANTVSLKGQTVIEHLKLPRYFAVFFNSTKNATLEDINVRQALSYATDRDAIVNEVLDGNGTVTTSPMTPGILPIAQPNITYAYNPAQAKALFEKSDWVYSNINKTLEKAVAKKNKKDEDVATQKMAIEITTSNIPELVTVANLLKKQWGTLGVDVSIKSLGPVELQQALKDRDYQALLFGEILGLDPEPSSFWHSSQKRDPGLNLALYENKNANKILEDTREILDQKERFARYAKLQDIILADAPAVFLYSPDYVYGHSGALKTFISPIIAMPADRYETISRWYINTTRVFQKPTADKYK